jgi:hypothetical protein
VLARNRQAIGDQRRGERRRRDHHRVGDEALGLVIRGQWRSLMRGDLPPGAASRMLKLLG